MTATRHFAVFGAWCPSPEPDRAGSRPALVAHQHLHSAPPRCDGCPAGPAEGEPSRGSDPAATALRDGWESAFRGRGARGRGRASLGACCHFGRARAQRMQNRADSSARGDPRSAGAQPRERAVFDRIGARPQRGCNVYDQRSTSVSRGLQRLCGFGSVSSGVVSQRRAAWCHLCDLSVSKPKCAERGDPLLRESDPGRDHGQ